MPKTRGSKATRSTKSAGRKAINGAKTGVAKKTARTGGVIKSANSSSGRRTKLKTSVYLERPQAERLARLSESLGRPQSEIVREAIETYEPAQSGDRNFALARGYSRIDEDPRPISEIPDSELLSGFGR